MTSALTIYSQFDTMQRASKALAASQYFTNNKGQPLDLAAIVVKVMAGAELGLPPFASAAGIHIVQGKPVLGSNVIATLVKNDPRYDYKVIEATDTACHLEWYEDDKPVGKAGFTIQEAQSAGLTSKDNWKKYPSDMLFARAISRGARRFAPGIFGGAPVYTPDEMNVDTDEEGYAVSPHVPTGITAVIQPWEIRRGPDADELQGGNGYRPGDEIVRARKAKEAAEATDGEYTDGPMYGDGEPVAEGQAQHIYAAFVAANDDAPNHRNHLKNWWAKHKHEYRELEDGQLVPLAEEDELFAEPTQPALVDEPDNGAYQEWRAPDRQSAS